MVHIFTIRLERVKSALPPICMPACLPLCMNQLENGQTDFDYIDIEEFLGKFSSLFSFHVDHIILTTTLHEGMTKSFSLYAVSSSHCTYIAYFCSLVSSLPRV